MMHYSVGRPQEKKFPEKWNEFSEYFRKFNIFPLRNVQNLFMRISNTNAKSAGFESIS
jgi:hypothetical protein